MSKHYIVTLTSEIIRTYIGIFSGIFLHHPSEYSYMDEDADADDDPDLNTGSYCIAVVFLWLLFVQFSLALLYLIMYFANCYCR